MFKTHILHYTKLVDRYTHIVEQLALQNITDYEFINSFNGDELTDKIINEYYLDDKTTCDEHSKVTLAHNKCADSVYSTLSKASISLNIKHIISLNKFVESDDEFLLVIEDDCNFIYPITPIDNIINNAPNNWDIIFIGGSFTYGILPIKSMVDGYILSGHPSTNTTSSLIYNKRSAQKTLEIMKPFTLPIDWHLNYVFAKNNFNVYHTNPYFCNQLSNKVFTSTVQR